MGRARRPHWRPAVVHLSATRKARDKAAATAAEEGGNHIVLLSRHEACPVAAGDHDPELMHFGNVQSRNAFDGEPVGFVNGCIDAGDDPILDLLAELDLDAEPKRSDVCCEHCGDCDDAPDEPGPGCQDCHGTGWSRAHGREFVGEDADSAQAILAAVRENEVAQAAGHYARNPDNVDDTATVFVRTDATPTGFVDVQVPGAEWVYTDTQERVVEALRERERPATALELADETDVSKRHVHRVLERLVDHDTVQAYDRAGPNGATLYADTGLPNAGVVDLTDEDGEVVTGPVWGTHTWPVPIHDPDRLRETSEPDPDGSPLHPVGFGVTRKSKRELERALEVSTAVETARSRS